MGFHRNKAGGLVHTSHSGVATNVPPENEGEYVQALHASERQEPVPPVVVGIAARAARKSRKKPRSQKASKK